MGSFCYSVCQCKCISDEQSQELAVGLANRKIAEQDLLDVAEDGDILLFNSNLINAKVQRTLLWADFDHVAVIVRTKELKEQNDFIILEAIAPEVRAVKWSNWRKVIKSLKDKGKCTLNSVYFRKVNAPRNSQTQENLIEFTKQSIGKKYSITYDKLLRQSTIDFTQRIDLTSVDEENYSYDRLSRKKRTFFCSELVAKALKIVNIIKNNETSCTQFYPKHFSSRYSENDE